jgi:hypothetical protein
MACICSTSKRQDKWFWSWKQLCDVTDNEIFHQYIKVQKYVHINTCGKYCFNYPKKSEYCDVLVNRHGIWIGNWIYWALSLIHTLYNLLQHAHNLLNLLRLHQLLLGNGSQRRRFLGFIVPRFRSSLASVRFALTLLAATHGHCLLVASGLHWLPLANTHFRLICRPRTTFYSADSSS